MYIYQSKCNIITIVPTDKNITGQIIMNYSIVSIFINKYILKIHDKFFFNVSMLS